MSSPRRRPSSPSAASPLDDDDLLSEILLRLPPLPSSLPRASLVCSRWRGIASDAGFSRRFRRHHRRNPPLLGFFDRPLVRSFLPALEAPNRNLPGRFSLPLGVDHPFRFIGCRHGLLLIFLPKCLQFLVWDPITGDQHRVAVPLGFDEEENPINGAVLRAAGDVHFQIVLVVADNDKMQHRRALARVYSSDAGVWGDIISTPIPFKVRNIVYPNRVSMVPAVLVGDSLHWLLTGGGTSILDHYPEYYPEWKILEFDLENQSLTLIPMPVSGEYCFMVMQAEGGGLGLLSVSEPDFTAKLWKRKTDCHGVASWVLERTIDLDNLLSLNLKEKDNFMILGFAEDNNLVVLCTVIGVYTIHLESLQFKKFLETDAFDYHQPFESVYTAEKGIGGGHGAADLLQNT